MTYNYNGFITKQRDDSDIQFITFIANAKEVYTWSHADSISLDKNGIQRDLVTSRWKRIKKYFDTNINNIIPNSVIIAYDISIKDDFKITTLQNCTIDNLKQISFNDTVKDQTFIIDGQHRLKGISELDYDVPIIVTMFLGINSLERAFQFITINNKAHKVPTDNIKALISNFDSFEDTLNERLATASISAGKFASLIHIVSEDKESPFYQKIDWPNNRNGQKLVKPLAIENSLKHILKNFPEFKDSEDDELLDTFYSIWKPIFNHYHITDATFSRYINLYKKATIQALTEFIIDKSIDQIIFAPDPSSISKIDIISTFSTTFIHSIPEDFWTHEWSYKSLDSQSGRKIIIDDIVTIKKNQVTGIDWNENVKLLSSTNQEK